MMGYSYSQDDGPVMCFNPPKSWYAGWYLDKSITVDPASTGDDRCFSGRIYGTVDYATAPGNIHVKITDGGTANDVYVGFNRKTGFNSGTVEAGNQVTVHTAGTGYSVSNLRSILGAGGSATRAVKGKNMVITVNEINTSASPGYADITISEDGAGCAPSTPNPTPPPTPNPTPAPTPAPVPTNDPTPPPTRLPTPSPTPPPTPAPVPTNDPTPPSTPPLTPAPTPPPVEPCAKYTGGGDCKKAPECTWDKGVCIAMP